jgi:2'-5' RNA ligase
MSGYNDDRQLKFDLLESPDPRRPKRPERVFTCIRVESASAIAEIESRREQVMCANAIRTKGIPPERFHISLCPLGDHVRIRSRLIFGARRAAGRFALPPFEIMLNRAVTLQGFKPDNRPTVLLAEGDGLRRLGDTLFRYLRQEGVRAGELRIPHLTLFYSPRPIRPVDIEPIRLGVDGFHLIHSERGLTRYNVLGFWPLAPDGGAGEPLVFGSMAA